MTKFTKLDADNLPEPNTLVWCRRREGRVQLATRRDGPIAREGVTPWDEYCWYGYEQGFGGLYVTNESNMERFINFSDSTVCSWAYVEAPQPEVYDG